MPFQKTVCLPLVLVIDRHCLYHLFVLSLIALLVCVQIWMTDFGMCFSISSQGSVPPTHWFLLSATFVLDLCRFPFFSGFDSSSLLWTSACIRVVRSTCVSSRLRSLVTGAKVWSHQFVPLDGAHAWQFDLACNAFRAPARIPNFWMCFVPFCR